MKLLLLLVVLFTAPAMAQEVKTQVKYCKNYETGQVIVVQVGYPCPFPTADAFQAAYSYK